MNFGTTSHDIADNGTLQSGGRCEENEQEREATVRPPIKSVVDSTCETCNAFIPRGAARVYNVYCKTSVCAQCITEAARRVICNTTIPFPLDDDVIFPSFDEPDPVEVTCGCGQHPVSPMTLIRVLPRDDFARLLNTMRDRSTPGWRFPADSVDISPRSPYTYLCSDRGTFVDILAQDDRNKEVCMFCGVSWTDTHICRFKTADMDKVGYIYIYVCVS